MINDPFIHRNRAVQEDTGAAIPCIVTGIDLSGDPLVSVKPLISVPSIGLDGIVEPNEPMIVDEIPYCYPSGSSFALFIPPEIGMQGFLIMTDTEIGEAASGVANISRRKNRGSGFFIPAGNMTGAAFKGSADWAEIRSKQGRIALSADTAHVQIGNNSIVLTANGFDVLSNGISLVAALKELDQHIKGLEAFCHLKGYPLNGAEPFMIDTLTAATPPQRNETGVR